MPEFLANFDLSTLRLDLMGRLLLASLLGGMVGLEREWSGKPAGFRTNLLICVGAALLTELSVSVAIAADPLVTTADPARIAAQIVSGIGFLGAGTIIQSRGSVMGLTTAATLWVVAAIGMAVGFHAYTEAVGTTALVIAALLLLGRLEPHLTHHVQHTLRVTFLGEGEIRDRVEDAMGEHLVFNVVELERKGDRVMVGYQVSGHRKHWKALPDRLMDVEGVERVVRG